MKLVLHFDGSVAINTLRQVLLAAGENTTVHYGAAHGLDAGALLSVVSAAGSDRRLVLGFDGARAETRNLQQAVSFAGPHTAVEINAAQAVNPAALRSTLAAAGDGRQVRATFTGSRASAEALLAALGVAGERVDIGIGAAQSLTPEALLAALEAAGDGRNLAVELSGTQPAAHLLQAVEAAGASTGIVIGGAQALTADELRDTLGAAGNGRHLSLVFNGAQAGETDLASVVAGAGTNTLVRVNTAESLDSASLLACIGATGNTRQLSVEFNGALQAEVNLALALEAAGVSTAVAVNTAQEVAEPSLLAAFEVAGDQKRFDAAFNGAQLTPEALQRYAGAAGQQVTLSIGGAHALPLPALLEAVRLAA